VRNKRRILWGLVLVAILGALAWVVLFPPESPVPRYKGRPFTDWLGRFQPGYPFSYPNIMDDHIAEEAVRSVGTNAIPTLLRMLRAHDPVWKRRFMDVMWKLHLGRNLKHIPAEWQNYQGGLAFRWLGTEASNAVPALVQIYGRSLSGDSRHYTIVALEAIHSRPELSVPVLIEGLNDPDQGFRFVAASGLSVFGTNAGAAVPALLKAMNDSSPSVRFSASRALKQIDPLAATKVLKEGK
jgi:hypothetical protein